MITAEQINAFVASLDDAGSIGHGKSYTAAKGALETLLAQLLTERDTWRTYALAQEKMSKFTDRRALSANDTYCYRIHEAQALSAIRLLQKLGEI